MTLPPTFRNPVLILTLALVIAGCGRRVDPRIQEGYDLVVAGKVDEAVAFMNSVLADDPDNAGAHNVIGMALYKMGDMEGSIERYRQALALDPKLAEAHFNLGNSFRVLNRLNEAEAEFAAAIRLDKKFVLAHHNLGILYEQSGRLDQAMAQYRKTIDYDPQYTFGYVDLGKLLYAAGDTPGAIANFSRALELDPGYKEVRVYLGNAYFRSGQPDAVELAENEYRAAVGLDPDYVEALYSLGIVLVSQQRTDEAEEWFDRVLELTKDDPENQMAAKIREYYGTTADPESESPESGESSG